jgi:NADH/F420H2 dehydrogenase subunit C
MKNTQLNQISKFCPIINAQSPLNEDILTISHKDLLFSLTCLKYNINYQYKILSCISGIDFNNFEYRFGIVYDLLSLTYNHRLRIKIFINEITPVESIINLYINSNWWEREIWDLYGIYFNNHPDLRRILTDYGFEGYPMKKDFPLSGFIELKYNQTKKRISLEPIELQQEFRSFTFESSWSN